MEKRKCTKCEKKFDREELIKWNGNRYCDNCARKIDESNKVTVGKVFLWGGAIVGWTSIIILVYWIAFKLILDRKKK